MITKKDRQILDEIINLEGKCLSSSRCLECPFKALCLPQFLAPAPLPQYKRLKMAVDVIAYNDLLGDSDIPLDVK